ncbi:MAG: glycine zipper 2TM domain-containing protein [Gammaproteobacteria bacterium]|nr:glycine zipper 2TM domain-containing protein [Gammaproteobacteria bacterium]
MKVRMVLAMISVALTGAAQAGHGARFAEDGYYTDAEVLDAKPIVRIVQYREPQENCWEETIRRERPGYRSRTPVVLGGILGGVAGHQFGSGRGNDIMTVAGALLGASIGRDAAYRHQAHRYPVHALEQRCEVTETVREEEQLEGYEVRYRLDGREFVTRTPTDPGRTLRVRVQVEPASYN